MRQAFYVEMEFDLANPSFPPKLVKFYPMIPKQQKEKKIDKSKLLPMTKTKVTTTREI